MRSVWRSGLGMLSRHGMLLVLLVLAAFFSLMTLNQQPLTGPEAARQVAQDMLQTLASESRVLVVASDQGNDPLFADQLTQQLVAAGQPVVATITGDPQTARRILSNRAQQNEQLEAIALSDRAASWLLFASLETDFPTLGHPALFQPRPYRYPSFLKADNLLNIANQISVIAILAIGMTIVIITGGIDLSVGSLIALSAVLGTWLVRESFGGTEATTFGMVTAAGLAILLCGAIGAFSGWMITCFAISPFIVTLAMMLVASGSAYLLSGGQSIAVLPDSFVWLGRGADLFGIPNAVLLMLILYGIAHLLMTRTTWGRRIYAVGGNCEAARLSGVPVRRVTVTAYVTCGFLAGLGGIIMASQLKSGSPAYGQMYELYVIAAVVVGGTSLRGGEGRIFGTLVGAFTIAVIQNGMNLMNVESYTQKVVLGLVILAAVLVDRLRHR
jgi:ribose transport system permease protein